MCRAVRLVGRCYRGWRRTSRVERGLGAQLGDGQTEGSETGQARARSEFCGLHRRGECRGGEEADENGKRHVTMDWCLLYEVWDY